MVVGGVIVFSEKQAIEITSVVDGKVDYVLVDAEKKVADVNSISGESSNIERAVREKVVKSTLWVYKGNDLFVEAVDSLLSYLLKDSLKGLLWYEDSYYRRRKFWVKASVEISRESCECFFD